MTDRPILRVERPYETEAEFLAAEGWSISRKSLLLIEHPSLLEGTTTRCELVLQSGVSLIVAEVVVARQVAASDRRPGGLVVRLKRMSPATAQFLERAAQYSGRNEAEASRPNNLEPSRPSASDDPLGAAMLLRASGSSASFPAVVMTEASDPIISNSPSLAPPPPSAPSPIYVTPERDREMAAPEAPVAGTSHPSGATPVEKKSVSPQVEDFAAAPAGGALERLRNRAEAASSVTAPTEREAQLQRLRTRS